MMVTYKDRKELLLYILFGFVAVLADLGIFYIFSEFERNYVLSAVLAFPLGVLTIYACVTYFNFKNVPDFHAILTAAFVCLFLDALLFYILLRLGVWLILSKSVAGIIALLCIYPMVKMLNFVRRLLSNQAIFKEPGFLLLLVVIFTGFGVHLMYSQYPNCLNLCNPSIFLGMLMNNVVGNSPYEDPIVTGVYSMYPWTGMFLLGQFVKITGLDPLKTFQLAGWLMNAFALLLVYLGGRRFGISGTALMLFIFLESIVVITQPWGIFGVFVHDGSHFLAFGLLIFSLATYLQNKRSGLIFLIVSFFIFSQFHFTNAVYALATLPAFFGIYYYVKKDIDAIYHFFIASACGIVSLFPTFWTWYLNGFHIGNPYITFRGRFYFIKELPSFLMSSRVISLLIAFLIIALVQYCFYFRDKSLWQKNRLVDLTAISILIVTVLLGFHHLILQPLFGFELSPNRFLETFLLFVIPLVTGLSFTHFKTLRSLDRLNNRAVFGIFAVIIFLTINHMLVTDDNIRQGMGSNIYPFKVNEMENVTRFVLEHTEPDETIATDYALGSVINTLTARKQVVTHNDHTNVFADFDKREVELALLFYSNNSDVIRNISDTYGIRYAMLRGSNTEVYLTSTRYEHLLEDNGVPYSKTLFNYGNCHDSGHCRELEVLYAGNNEVSKAFIAVFNKNTTISFNGAPLYIFKKSIPSMNLSPKVGDA